MPLTGSACLVALDQIQQSYDALTGGHGSGGCSSVPRLLVSTLATTQLSTPAALSCPLTISLNQFDKDTLQPLAKTHFGQSVKSISHVGGFACRGIRGNPAIPSEHAFANALDITGFTLADGRSISVTQYWHSPDPTGQFLRDIAAGAARHFATVLTPDYDSRHASHFHFGHQVPKDTLDTLANLLSKDLYKGDARSGSRSPIDTNTGPIGAAPNTGEF